MIDSLLSVAQHGIGGQALWSPFLHVAVGGFFAISGYHKLTNAERHRALVETFKADHVPFIAFNQWWVPGWELMAGTALVFGLFPAAAAAILAIICTVASLCEGPKRVAAYAPMDLADKVDDYLYLPEVLYGIVLTAIAMGA